MNEFDDKSASKERLARQQVIGTELREVFGRVEAEPIPDTLLELAAELDKNLARRKSPVLTLVPADTDKGDKA